MAIVNDDYGAKDSQRALWTFQSVNNKIKAIIGVMGNRTRAVNISEYVISVWFFKKLFLHILIFAKI